jgi:hypothetical protein
LISWPLSFCSHELIEFTGALEALKGLRGEMRQGQAWNALQRKNQRQIEEERGIDAASETNGSVLVSNPDKILKLAMIFEVGRWLKDKRRDWQVIQADSLDLAARHEAYCVAANRDLDAGEASIDAVNREGDRISPKAPPAPRA